MTAATAERRNYRSPGPGRVAEHGQLDVAQRVERVAARRLSRQRAGRDAPRLCHGVGDEEGDDRGERSRGIMNVTTASICGQRRDAARLADRSWRGVPRLYSLAVCAAAVPNATMPSRNISRVRPKNRPFEQASCCREGRPPPVPFTAVAEDQHHEQG